MEQLAAATDAPSLTGAGAAPPRSAQRSAPRSGSRGGGRCVRSASRGGGQCGRSPPLRPAAGPVRSPVAIVRFGDAS